MNNGSSDKESVKINTMNYEVGEKFVLPLTEILPWWKRLLKINAKTELRTFVVTEVCDNTVEIYPAITDGEHE